MGYHRTEARAFSAAVQSYGIVHDRAMYRAGLQPLSLAQLYPSYPNGEAYWHLAITVLILFHGFSFVAIDEGEHCERRAAAADRGQRRYYRD
jgi:hypothetical protein